MKILYPLLSIVFFYTATFAQQLPNSGFETWVNVDGIQLDPTGYYTPDSAEVAFGSVECVLQSTDAHSGQFSVKLKSVTAAIPPVNGRIILGNSLEKGIPFTGKPTALRGWTKSNLNGESATVSIGIKKDGNLIGENSLPFVGNYGWTQFVMPIFYIDSSVTPDSITFLVSLAGSSDGEFLIDDFELLYGVVGIDEVNSLNASLYPNPARNGSRLLLAGVSGGFQYVFSDPSGRKIASGNLVQGEAHINPPTSGFYFVTVINANGVIVSRKKLIAL